MAAKTDVDLAQRVLRGIGVSAGSVSGLAVVIGLPPQVPADEPPSNDVESDWARIADALRGVAENLEKKAVSVGGPAVDILSATALMARDPSLGKGIRAGLEAGRGPANAVHAAVEDVCTAFTAAGGYLAERTTDLRDVASRVIARLLGVPEPSVPELTQPSVLIARDLAPADTAGLSPTTTLAIVTELGGPTSHTAILAAQLGIPAVVHVVGALAIEAGTVIAVDGSAGTVTIAPDEAEQAEIARRRATRDALVSSRSGPGATRDGHSVHLLANIGTVGDAKTAATADVEGVGLFRTEFLFLDRASAPTVAEQTVTYKAVLEGFAGKYVTVRTLDAGADKPLPFADLGPEENPALGVRGLRLSQRRPELLHAQLAALGAAAVATGVEVKVMAPMVATPDEARWFTARAHAHGLTTTGVMVEVPAAALRAGRILAEVDFVSLGTNDLAQYTMAADRLSGELADLLDSWQPALLDLVAVTADAGAAEGKRVGVCGEAAGDPLLALVLTGLGVTSLSMAASKVAAVRYALSEHDLDVCRAMASAAREANGPAAARSAVRALCSESVAAIL